MKYKCNRCKIYFDDKKMYASRYESVSAITYDYYCKECAKKEKLIEEE